MEGLNTTIDPNSFQLVSAGRDVDPMYALSQGAGWNQTINDLKCLTSENPTGNLLAVADSDKINKKVGSGLVLNVGEQLSWIGMILVHPEFRRQGVATAIMEKCIEVARLVKNKPVVGLDATPAGLQVYQNIGFRKSFILWRCTLSTNLTSVPDKPIRVSSLTNLDAQTEFLKTIKQDKKMTGLRLIHRMHPEGTFLAELEGGPCGIIMTRPGRLKPFIGPLMATSISAARSLLDQVLRYWQEKGYDEVFIDVPEKHFEIASRWENEMTNSTPPANCLLGPGVRPTRGLVRMYEMIDDAVLGQLTHRSSANIRYLRDVNALDHGRASYESTTSYVQKELESLKFLYALGGPELS